jgi:hypothetical protein
MEARLVLSQLAVTPAADAAQGASFLNRRLDYRTPGGTHVTVTLYGAGSLAGSSLNADGSLNLVYSGTSAGSVLIASAHGGNHFVPLRSLLPAGQSPQNLTGVGASPIGNVRLTSFTLVSGGQVNLTAGVNIFQLYAVQADTQINLRELPQTLSAGNGGTAVGGDNGVTLTYGPAGNGGQVLTSVTGQFKAGKNLAYANPTTNGVPNPGDPAAPPGLDIKIQHVAGPDRASTSLDNVAGSALVDVQGNVQYYKGVDAHGLVLNDMGNLNLVKLKRVSDTTIVGEPFGHASLPNRQNTTIISTTRTTGTKDGVTVVPNLPPIGPLSQP